MEAVVLAELQVFVAMHAQGYHENVDDQSFVKRPAVHERGEDWLCHNQNVVKLSGFSNINVFGFSFIMATTLLLVSFDYGVIRICVHYHTRVGRRSFPVATSSLRRARIGSLESSRQGCSDR
jgi:hypothetical protein